MKTQEWGREREESRDCLEKHGRERDGETKEGWQRDGGKGEPIALRLRQRERERKKRGRAQKSDSLTATPNGFSGEREGVQRRRRHNEGAMTEAEIDLER